MNNSSIITDLPQPAGYTNVMHFTQNEWDSNSFATEEDMKWWMDAKFGMFIHWGPCVLSGIKGFEIGWGRRQPVIT
ncbi:MAG: alpha-L-fucosidase [Saccharofermentanales bacterium]